MAKVTGGPHKVGLSGGDIDGTSATSKAGTEGEFTIFRTLPLSYRGFNYGVFRLRGKSLKVGRESKVCLTHKVKEGVGEKMRESQRGKELRGRRRRRGGEVL